MPSSDVNKKIVAMIPARYAASRFPGKLLQPLGEKSVIRHVYDNTVSTGLFDDVLVITDDKRIYDEITKHGGRAVMSRNEHESGSDRIAEVAAEMNVDVIVNVQGDEPFISKEPLRALIGLFADPDVQVGSLMARANAEQAADPNEVKVVVDKKNDALYFSRSAIPFARGKVSHYFIHLGVYAYRKEALLQFTKWPVSGLEAAEKLEQLRYLENGIGIRLAETDYVSVSIDSPEDLEMARRLI